MDHFIALQLHEIYFNVFAFSHDVKKSVYHAGGSRICFPTGLEPAESLLGGLCLLASAQVVSGRIKGTLVARPLQHARTQKSKHKGTHTITPITMAYLEVCASTLGATHVSESVPGSVLAVLSRGARPFVVSGESRACAQQESHHRQQEEEHLLTARRHRR